MTTSMSSGPASWTVMPGTSPIMTGPVSRVAAVRVRLKLRLARLRLAPIWRDLPLNDPSAGRLLSDADGAFTEAMGMSFDAPPAGLFGRSKRYAMLVDGGVVTEIQVEESPGACSISSGDSLLDLV